MSLNRRKLPISAQLEKVLSSAERDALVKALAELLREQRQERERVNQLRSPDSDPTRER